MTTIRRLAAILAADVVGYSRLMAAEEVGTLDALKACRREVVDPAIASHRGRIVKTTGDGMLVEFASAVDAATCAMAVQETMATRGGAITFRIGINVGDIIIDGDDIFGDGVNVAARVEDECQPGGVCLSASACEQVRNKTSFVFDDLGEHALKNIDIPVRLYAARMAADASATLKMPEPGKPLPLPDKPSIAVLPFQNMSGDPEQEYFADGMVEDIITALSRFKSLFVIARNSSFTYKGKTVDIKQVGRELGVRYVLEGSVRKAGGRLRLTGQLIDATTGAHLWADKFDGAPEDVFELQDQVTVNVVGAIAPAIQQAEIERVKRKPTDSLHSYDCYLRGVASLSGGQPQHALGWFKEAIRRDPEYAGALVMVAFCLQNVQSRYGSPMSDEDLCEAIRCVRHAAAIAPDDAFILSRTAHTLCYLAKEYDLATAMSDQALQLNSNLAGVWHARGWIGIMRGDGARAIECFTNVNRISPVDPQRNQSWNGLAWACFFQERYAEGCEWATRSLQKGDAAIYLSALIVNATCGGRHTDARDAVNRLMALAPNFRVSFASKSFPTTPELSARIADALKLAGVPE
jgi:adenylate cyclase